MRRPASHESLDTVEGMSWKAFVGGLRAVFSEPRYLREMTPEERELRRRWGLRVNWGLPWIFQALEPPPRLERRENEEREDPEPDEPRTQPRRR
jgi:hypothetical protein